MVTVAIRRMNIGQDKNSQNLLMLYLLISTQYFPIQQAVIQDDAIRTCELTAELSGKMLVKLEVL